MFFKDEAAGLFIAVPDSARGQLVYKWPDNSIRKLSAVIVEPDELALFVSRGVVVGIFGPGRHSVDAKEWPFLGVLIDAVSGGNAYRAELFFVSTKQFPNEKFGSKVDNVQDPRTGLVVSLLLHGEYAVQVTDPQKLILNLVGTGAVEADAGVLDWVDQQLLKTVRHFVTEKVTTNAWPVLGLSAYLPELEQTTIENVNLQLLEYGLTIPRMGNVDVSLSGEDEEQVKKLSQATAMSQLAGSYNAYAAGAAMIGVGEGMALGGGSPAMLAAGIGLGGGLPGMMAGAAAGGAPAPTFLPPPAGPSTPPPFAGPPTGPPVAGAPVAVAPVIPTPLAADSAVQSPAPATDLCGVCGKPLGAHARFCASCGTQVPVASACTNCGFELPAGTNFCPQCGTPNAIVPPAPVPVDPAQSPDAAE